jgi:hypothetical protein
MNFLRWIAILPASFLALFLSSQLVKLYVFIGNVFNPDDSTNPDGILIQCIIAGINVYAFVGVGTLVAPKKQGLVLNILLFLMILITIGQFYLFYDVIVMGFKYFEWKSFWTNLGLVLSLRTLVSLGMCVYGLFTFWNADEDD